MLGCYDFCGHYDWTFRWIEQNSDRETLHEYWEESICKDSQSHAAALIAAGGVAGMAEYWGHTLAEEAPEGGYSARVDGDRFLVEMTDCPSRGFLLRNKIEFSGDYCDHCIGWIGPMMKEAGFSIHHAHNHQGQCYWEFRPSQAKDGDRPDLEQWEATLRKKWSDSHHKVDAFTGKNSAGDKD